MNWIWFIFTPPFVLIVVGILELLLRRNDYLVKCDYCDEDVVRVRPTPFMADAGAKMCEGCWDMTRDTYIGSIGEDIGIFKDYPHFPKEDKRE